MAIRVDLMVRTFAPALAAAAMAALTACNSAPSFFNSAQGVTLAELDMTGEAPRSVALAGPDRVLVSDGDEFDIAVDGPPSSAEDLRFLLEDGGLKISRLSGSESATIATIRVTLPGPPNELTIAGSGQIVADRLASTAEIAVAGSGTVETPNVAADFLEVSIAGSGTYRGAGSAQKLELNMAGSGDIDLAGLTADRVDVSIAGSGDAVFASDGEVSASIMGSGDVTVRGSARCTVDSMGSGTLTCERGVDEG